MRLTILKHNDMQAFGLIEILLSSSIGLIIVLSGIMFYSAINKFSIKAINKARIINKHNKIILMLKRDIENSGYFGYKSGDLTYFGNCDMARIDISIPATLYLLNVYHSIIALDSLDNKSAIKPQDNLLIFDDKSFNKITVTEDADDLLNNLYNSNKYIVKIEDVKFYLRNKRLYREIMNKTVTAIADAVDDFKIEYNKRDNNTQNFFYSDNIASVKISIKSNDIMTSILFPLPPYAIPDVISK